jgi:hypothetical protein
MTPTKKQSTEKIILGVLLVLVAGAIYYYFQSQPKPLTNLPLPPVFSQTSGPGSVGSLGSSDALSAAPTSYLPLGPNLNTAIFDDPFFKNPARPDSPTVESSEIGISGSPFAKK